MTDYEFGQAVMKAAGVEPDVVVGGIVTPMRGKYPDPLTPAGFCALWDALESRGYLVDISMLRVEGGKVVYVVDVTKAIKPIWEEKASNEDRKIALLEAAAQALEVPRG